ncbi:hypothetical protein J7F02_25650 [Streptomyces sp. ISL-112]|uniref:hypothetical protein n=1 Tax=unclassified Streptomyces TaxID=2593676 RepID=UPI001BE6EEB8|nr:MULTISPECIES: hypothetical protein [unclassified Streptomyces]MBT2428918.1 hypothetical protein [Streptomyces sp. ISL-112]MBT2464184.1 hypothetical protein [Streptomyces sp. ISL-63]
MVIPGEIYEKHASRKPACLSFGDMCDLENEFRFAHATHADKNMVRDSGSRLSRIRRQVIQKGQKLRVPARECRGLGGKAKKGGANLPRKVKRYISSLYDRMKVKPALNIITDPSCVHSP